MTLPASIGGRAVVSARPVAGGDLNDAFAVELEGGERAFVKTRAGADPGEYATEAAGLRWLGEPGALGVPEVIEAADGFLALEWLDEGPRLGAEGEEALGRGLAAVHGAGAERFGAPPPGAPMPASAVGGERSAAPPGAPAPGRSGAAPPGAPAAAPLRLGPLVLPNEPAPDWPAFYAERRLLPLADGFPVVERVCERVHDLAGPPEPPARLHGDLWSGNVLASRGRPYLIDPAAYGGHREVDLAMLRLFGSPGPRFLAAYEEVAPLAFGHEDRVALYQLFPLLVHARLFGGGYAASVERAARRYA